jgi:hypothetical protein
VLFSLLGLVAGCGAPPDLDPSTTASRSQGLYYTPEHAWGARDVQVCWSDLQADEVEASQWIEDAYRGQRSWIHDGNIVLTGWGPCGNQITGIQLTAGNHMATQRYSVTDQQRRVALASSLILRASSPLNPSIS